MYIQRKQLDNLNKFIQPNKVIVIYGPRRSGKTTLIRKFLETVTEPYRFVRGEDIAARKQLGSESIDTLTSFVGDYKLVIIDEAQKIPEIGLNLKLMVDHIPGLKIIATGSSSFNLAHQLGEPLTGRKYTLLLLPLAQLELNIMEDSITTTSKLEQRLIYGAYPETVLIDDNDKRRVYLQELVSSALYKDILELDGLRHNDKLDHLLQLLAFQIGQEVSSNELGTQLGMSRSTVEKYLDLLCKTFVITRLLGFSRNLRKEITKNAKYYFLDLGVRNALIDNFNPLLLRNDVGMLWENYLIVERLKRQAYIGPHCHNYFWRTYDQQEIDWIEEYGGKLYGYEMKWQTRKLPKVPKIWLSTYKNASYEVISQENYLEFIT